MQKKIVGVFDTEREASQAIEGLKAQGFNSDEISVVTQDRDELKAIREETGTKAPEGVAAGPIAAAFTGAAVGAGAGGLVGGLVGLGIPEEDAKQYEEYVQNGKILLLVDSTDRDSDVYDVFSNTSYLNRDRYAAHGTDVPAERTDLDMEERRLEAQDKAARFGNNTFL